MRAAWCLVLLALSAPALRAQEPPVRARFDVAVDLEEHEVRFTGTLEVTNEGPRPLDVLPLVLYGNRFRALDPAITDFAYDRFYAPWFDAGRVKDLRVADADGVALTLEPTADGVLDLDEHEEAVEDDGPGASVVVHVRLPAPLAPGAAVVLQVAGTLEVPSRLGPFGHRGRRLVLEGGWLPWVPARDAAGVFDPLGPPAWTRWALGVELRTEEPAPDDRLLLAGAEVAPTSSRVVSDGPAPSLVAGPELDLLLEARPRSDDVADDPAPWLRVVGPAGDEERARRIAAVAARAATFARVQYGLTASASPLVFVQAPLRDRYLHVVGDGSVVLWSERLFHVFVPLQGFHELEVGRATLEAIARRALGRTPPGTDRDWSAEALGWLMARAWIEEGRRGGLTGATLRAGLGFFDFIPAIDALVRAPRFVGSDLYYGRFHEPAEAVPDDVTRALSRRPRGRIVAEKLVDLLGPARTELLLQDTLRNWPTLGVQGPEGLRRRAARLAGRDLTAFFDLWTRAPRPVQNLAIEEVEVLGPAPGGGERVRVHLRRDGDARVGKVGEPVDVQTTDPKDEEKTRRARWDGVGDRGWVETERATGLLDGTVRLDPDLRVEQGYRGDDQDPALAKVLLNRARIKLDLNNTNRNEGAVGLTIVPFYDYRHAILLDAFYQQDEYGAAVGYAYGFGFNLDERRYGATVSTRLVAEELTTGVLQGGAESLETSGSLVSVAAGLSFDTFAFRDNPTWGVDVGFNVEHSDKALGTDFRFDLYAGSMSFVYSIVRGTQLGCDVVAGQLEGTDIPSQRLFDAGGEGTVRGVRASRFLGQALFVVRTELRQMLLEDLDVPLLWVAWLRKLQMVLFIDAGDVDRSVDRILTRGDWRWGTGIGGRAWLDIFGVTPTVLRFDVGWRIDDYFDDIGPQFYLGIGQNF